MKFLVCLAALWGSAAGACGYIPRDLYDWSVYYAHRFGLDGDLLVSLIWVESQYCPNAVSPDNAQGLGQLMPGTARAMGVKDPFDPVQNIFGSARYLRSQWDTFQNWDLALAAYNAGPGAVINHKGVPPYPETLAYINKVMDTYRSLKLVGLTWQD